MRKKDEAIKAAIAEHLREFLASRPDVPLMVISCSEVFWDRLANDYLTEPLPPPLVRSGHPFELDDLGSVAYASLSAAVLVDHLTEQFRKRFRRKHVPEVARDEYINFAMDIYRTASKHSIKERIRLRKKDIFVGGLGCVDEEHGSPGLAPVTKELAPANSISPSDNSSEVEEMGVRAMQIIVGRLS